MFAYNCDFHWQSLNNYGKNDLNSSISIFWLFWSLLRINEVNREYQMKYYKTSIKYGFGIPGFKISMKLNLPRIENKPVVQLQEWYSFKYFSSSKLECWRRY